MKKLSISLDESVAERAASAAASHGVSLSAWLNAAAERAIRIEDGLAAVREWEQEHGELSAEERAWADKAVASDLRAGGSAVRNRIVPGRVGLLERRGGYAPRRDCPEDFRIEDVFGPVEGVSAAPKPADSPQNDDE